MDYLLIIHARTTVIIFMSHDVIHDCEHGKDDYFGSDSWNDSHCLTWSFEPNTELATLREASTTAIGAIESARKSGAYSS